MANRQVHLIGMEACGGTHFLGRALQEQGKGFFVGVLPLSAAPQVRFQCFNASHSPHFPPYCRGSISPNFPETCSWPLSGLHDKAEINSAGDSTESQQIRVNALTTVPKGFWDIKLISLFKRFSNVKPQAFAFVPVNLFPRLPGLERRRILAMRNLPFP